MTRAGLHRPPKGSNRIISSLKKNRRTTVPHQNGSSDQTKKKREKMTFNPQWLKKYNLVAELREVLCHDMLTVFQ